MHIDRSSPAPARELGPHGADLGGSSQGDIELIERQTRPAIQRLPTWQPQAEAAPPPPPLAGLGQVARAVRGLVDQVVERVVQQIGPRSTPAPEPALDAVLASTQLSLATQAADAQGFNALLRQAFGDQIDAAQVNALREQLRRGDWSWAPQIEVVSERALADLSGTQGPGRAWGAYAQASDTVYLSRERLLSDPAAAQRVLIEELGHALDARLNTRDSAGDEGALFARLVSGETLSAQALQALRAENDHGLVRVAGQTLAVEFDWEMSSGAELHYGATLVSDALTTEPAASDDSLLQASLGAVAEQLRQMAGDANGFMATLRQLYGDALNLATADALRQSILAGDFSWSPRVEPAAAAELGGATCQYDGGRNCVRLSREQLRSSPEQAQQALLGSLPEVLRTRLTASAPAPTPAPAAAPSTATSTSPSTGTSEPVASSGESNASTEYPEEEDLEPQPNDADPGDRTEDFAFIARHDDWVKRTEAEVARWNELEQQAATLQEELAWRSSLRFGVSMGGQDYANEVAIESLMRQQWALQDELEELEAADAVDLSQASDESAAEIARLNRQSQAAQNAEYPLNGVSSPWLWQEPAAGGESRSVGLGTAADSGASAGLGDRNGSDIQSDAAAGTMGLAFSGGTESATGLVLNQGSDLQTHGQEGESLGSSESVNTAQESDTSDTDSVQVGATDEADRGADWGFISEHSLQDRTSVSAFDAFTNAVWADQDRLNSVGYRSNFRASMGQGHEDYTNEMAWDHYSHLLCIEQYRLREVEAALEGDAELEVGMESTGGLDDDRNGSDLQSDAASDAEQYDAAEDTDWSAGLDHRNGSDIQSDDSDESFANLNPTGMTDDGVGAELALSVEGIEWEPVDLGPELSRAPSTLDFEPASGESDPSSEPSAEDPASGGEHRNGSDIQSDAATEEATGTGKIGNRLDPASAAATGSGTRPAAASGASGVHGSSNAAANPQATVIGYGADKLPVYAHGTYQPQGEIRPVSDAPTLGAGAQGLLHDAQGATPMRDGSDTLLYRVIGGQQDGQLVLIGTPAVDTSDVVVVTGSRSGTNIGNEPLQGLGDIATQLGVDLPKVPASPFAAQLAVLVVPALNAEMRSGNPALVALGAGTLVAGLGVAHWLASRKGEPGNEVNSSILPEEERGTPPMINVPVPPPPAPPGYESPAEHDVSSLPGGGVDSDSPLKDPLPGFDMRDPHWSDGVVTKDGNADNNSARAARRHAADPSLASPGQLLGTQEPGVGTWVAPETPRGDSGADYQEHITGVPSGIELNVGGAIRTTPNGTPTAEGGANFDGIRTEGSTTVLVDAKDWNGFLLPDQRWWVNTVNTEAKRQVDAAGSLGGSVRIEWVVPTDEQADAIKLALTQGNNQVGITVVVKPKTGG